MRRMDGSKHGGVVLTKERRQQEKGERKGLTCAEEGTFLCSSLFPPICPAPTSLVESLYGGERRQEEPARRRTCWEGGVSPPVVQSFQLVFLLSPAWRPLDNRGGLGFFWCFRGESVAQGAIDRSLVAASVPGATTTTKQCRDLLSTKTKTRNCQVSSPCAPPHNAPKRTDGAPCIPRMRWVLKT